MKAHKFLIKAAKLMTKRAKTYDSKGERSGRKTAEAFNAITGHNLSEAEVYLLLQILKDVRAWQNPLIPHKDSFEDCVAYAALKGEAAMLNKSHKVPPQPQS